MLAFLDIGPVSKGHTLIIPKEHYQTMMDLPDDLLCEAIKATKKIATAVMKAVEAGGISISNSNYAAAGQVVPHAHFHVMPRHANDGLKHWPQQKYLDNEMETYAEKIRKYL